MQKVKSFLKKHWDGASPLLLGYSGGHDSKALLYSLLEEGVSSLHVAHVDHGWREESREEAKCIRQEIEGLSLPLHTTRLAMAMERNKEEVAREERLHFFHSLCQKFPFQALVLGHHADDLAETALKRLFEGAHLPMLGGMEPSSSWKGMSIWRPLLQMKKKDLALFLEKRKLSSLNDPTNCDPVYLRSRLRRDTLPLLERSFGKNILQNLCYLSDRAHELKQYLDKKIANCPIRRGDWGVAIPCGGLDRIEQRHLVHQVFIGEEVFLTRKVLDSLLDWAEDPFKMRKVFFQSRWIVGGRGWVVLLQERTYPGIGFVRKTLNFL